MDKVAIICLGALGDCCNALPLALHEFQQDNNVTFFIAQEFASLLDGVTYCEREIWPGHYSECLQAAERAANSGKYDRIMVVQCYGTNIDRQTDSYCKEAWRAVGKLHLWGKLPLVFDNRDKKGVCFDGVPKEKRDLPILIVSYSGKSSPFPHIQSLLELIKSIEDRFYVVDISNQRHDHFYDLLNLMEVATCLIATDSGPLHLANAVPKLPVVSLITDKPDLWHGSPRQSNHIARIRYGEFLQSRDAIVRAVLSTLEPEQINSEPALFHIWNDYDRSDDGNIHRHHLAAKTWEKVYSSNKRWVPYPVHLNSLTRNSLGIGEVRHTPYVKDAINLAAAEAQPNDILVFTNDDGLLLDGFTDLILSTLRDRPAMWCPRWELPLNAEQKWGNPKGYKHCGADVFAFTKQWWTENEPQFPDHLISFEAWDLNLRMLIEMTGGVQVEGLVAHYIHQPVWHSPEHREGVGNLHNRKLFQQWLAQRNLRWPSP